jgi:hypothetical protein
MQIESIDQKGLLISLVREYSELFHDQYGEPFAVVRADSHREIWPVRSKSLKSWICKLSWNQYGIAPSGSVLSDALRVIEGLACFESPEHKLHNQLAWDNDAIYYDLSDSRWRAVRIDHAGWDIVDPPILFRRYAHQKAQVEPIKADAKEYTEFLSQYFNVKNEHDERLLLVTIATYAVPSIVHPASVLYGCPGSAKSTTLRLIKELIDPSVISQLALPRNEGELIQQLAHHYFCSYDNISQLSDWISDALCRCITGAGFSKRKLYTNDDDVIFQLKRPVGLNGINVVPRNGDLLERSVLMELKKPATYAPEDELWRQFQKDKARILGDLFATISRALDSEDPEPISNVRMADYLRWGEAIGRALGYGKNAFVNVYLENSKTRNIEALQAHPVGPVILELMRHTDEWKGSASDLLVELERIAKGLQISTRTGRWPKSPSALTRRLNEVKANLQNVGITFEVTKSGDRRITVRKNAVQAVQAVQAVHTGNTSYIL